MGFEYRLRFADTTWYEENRARLRTQILSLPHVVRAVSQDEIWLKDNSPRNSWPYDMRIFFRADRIDIEVSATSNTFHVDLRSLLEWIRREVAVAVVDDDDESLPI
jgi:hypothetical protein